MGSTIATTKGPRNRGDYTWGFLNGFNAPSSMKGFFKDWIFARGATEDELLNTGAPITLLATLVNTLGFAAFTGTNGVWIYVPIGEAGYSTFLVNLTSNFAGGNVKCTAWAVAENIKPLPGGLMGQFAQMLASVYIVKDATLPVVAGAQLAFGPGGTDLAVQPAYPYGGIIIKLERESVSPTSGACRLYISRG